MRKTILFLFVLPLCFGGCRQSGDTSSGAAGHSHGVEGDHEHEVETAQITVWTNGYEIFAEHTAPAAGRDTRFITHVSELQSGKPRTSGPVKFIFRQGQSSFEHPQAAPERPGIYIPEVTFPSEGDWEASLIIPSETNATIHLGTIHVFPNEEAALHADFADPPEGISFLKEQQWRIRLQTEPVAERTLAARTALPASIQPKPGGIASIHSPVAGRLRMPENSPMIGQRVERGEVLAHVEPAFNEFTIKLVEAEAAAARSKAELEQAQAAFERTKTLVEQSARSQRELQQAEAAYLSARAAHQAALAVQKIFRETGAEFTNGEVLLALKSPIAGVLEEIGAGAGERIGAEQALFRIVNSDSVYLQARVPEANLHQVESAAPATLELFTHPEPIDLRGRAKLVAVSREVDPVTRTVALTYEVADSAGQLRLNAMGTLHVLSGTPVQSLALPKTAVVEDEGVPIAFVQLSGETFEKRDLQPGLDAGEWLQVVSGLEAGERVVTQGAYPILLSTKSGVIPAHGHAH